MEDKGGCPIDWLQSYVGHHANGEWEHVHNLSIALIDNPGWSMRCDIDTEIYLPVIYSGIRKEINDRDWLHCWYDKKEFSFKGACGVENLKEMIEEFRIFTLNNLISKN